MKKIILFVLVFAGLSFIANAQTEPTSKKAATKEEKKQLKEDLNLSKEQKAELKEVIIKDDLIILIFLQKRKKILI